jgi:topoisomerase-4 subunit A
LEDAEDADASSDLLDEDPDANKSEQQIIDEITGQTNLFSDEDF